MTSPEFLQSDERSTTEAGFSGWAVASTADAFPQPGRAPMGRHVAGEGFLSGLARHAQDEPIAGFGDLREKEPFEARIRAAGSQRRIGFIDHRFPERLAGPGNLITHAPDLAHRAWQRTRRAPDGYSLVGVTHSLSGTIVREAICAMSTAPVATHDALVCTSRAAHGVVTRLLEAQEEDLRRRLGATRFPRPQLPIIPLGVETAAFSPQDSQNRELRARERERLGLSGDDLMVLSVGRLDPLSKAWPMPLLVALSRVESMRRIKLVMAGSSPPGPSGHDAAQCISRHLRDTARAIDPRLDLVVRPDLTAQDLRAAYAAADVFAAMSDNIQETFGLAVIEAMAAGLPVVVSDWSGYRDLVREAIDGFLVPTRVPPESFSERVAGLNEAQQIGYREYAGAVSALTVVDVDTCADRIGTLAADPELRARMGEAARARAVQQYDWAVVIGQYRALIDACAERRAAGSSVRFAAPAHPSPFGLFGEFASTRLEMATMVAPGEADLIKTARLQPMPLGAYCGAEAVTIMARLGSEAMPLQALLGCCRDIDPGRVTATVMALSKIGALRLS
ncbi:MAG: Glycosyltransferase [Saliniramus fredricksonii]|uniref:Glycosyltransferase n=1 Tax=Saliniramus fredricksonii TaxID=1653334 RepID=A0A0P8BIG1_9HYPH|nr:glycosyltransferase family 4 protein [Saliniramus fredricksonii]KPQ09032.1 MAG: Glycosyltransferase [Saliniramus fredricksonii]SCC79635.1 Glycosyltransferase involved in cell wall bisynthesis [Saliniramus fredricksonii]